MQDRTTGLAVVLAASQIVDAVANELVPRRYLQAHLDHLGVPERLRPALPMIKVASSAGLLLGTKFPRLGVLTSAGLVTYYAAAVAFHILARDHRVVALPAATFGASAAVAFVRLYLPAVARR